MLNAVVLKYKQVPAFVLRVLADLVEVSLKHVCRLGLRRETMNEDTGSRFGGSACYNFIPNISLHIQYIIVIIISILYPLHSSLISLHNFNKISLVAHHSITFYFTILSLYCSVFLLKHQEYLFVILF